MKKKTTKQNPDESTYNKLLKLVNKKIAIIGDENYYGVLYGINKPIGRTGYTIADREKFSVIYYVDNNSIGYEYILNIKDVKDIDGRKIILKSKPFANPKPKRKNPDQDIIRKQLEKFITLPGETEYKKVVLMSDPYLFGKLEPAYLWEDESTKPFEWGKPVVRWSAPRLDKENLILVVRHQIVSDLDVVYSRSQLDDTSPEVGSHGIYSKSQPGVRETWDKYKFNINDIIRIDGRKIYLNKKPKLIEHANSGRRV